MRNQAAGRILKGGHFSGFCLFDDPYPTSLHCTLIYTRSNHFLNMLLLSYRYFEMQKEKVWSNLGGEIKYHYRDFRSHFSVLASLGPLIPIYDHLLKCPPSAVPGKNTQIVMFYHLIYFLKWVDKGRGQKVTLSPEILG